MSPVRLRSSPFAAALRNEISARNCEYAERHGLEACHSYGDPPVVCYAPSPDGTRHGNFLPQAYGAIQRHPDWAKRLSKVHAQARQALPRREHRWRELDSSNSSDALLMNIFCFPAILRRSRVCELLGLAAGLRAYFGVKARVPLANGLADRTEVDMRIGQLLVEAKLTESDFQSREAAPGDGYRDFSEVFDKRSLPRDGDRYLSCQLIRNVLAAHHLECSFCVMIDARRPDLKEAWYEVMRCVRPVELRSRCMMLTWQELASALPPKLQCFLQEKYGIVPPGSDCPRSFYADVQNRFPEPVYEG